MFYLTILLSGVITAFLYWVMKKRKVL